MISFVNTHISSPMNCRNIERLSKYRSIKNEFEFEGITKFSVDIQDIYTFEKNIILKFFNLK